MIILQNQRNGGKLGSELTVGSLFSGIGGFDKGLEMSGMNVLWQVEIDEFCNKVLNYYWPNVERHSDVSKVENLPRPDLICGGFPCQDLSVAGKRAGLDGERSGLWFEMHRIMRELRSKWCLIENVPGLLSSNQGRDFGVIAEGMDELWSGSWGWAILDSQNFGVPQRRRRVFIVGGPSRSSVAKVLSLTESGSGDFTKSQKSKQDIALPIGGGSGNRGWRDDLDHSTYIPIICPTIDTHLGDKQWLEDQSVLNFLPVMKAISIRTAQTSSNGWGINTDGTSYTLDSASGQAVAAKSTVRRLTPVECERLQGFPDDWTNIPVKEVPRKRLLSNKQGRYKEIGGKVFQMAADGPRYKSLGNAVTVNVIYYLGSRIRAVEENNL